MRQWIGSALAQIMACCLFGARLFSKPILGVVNWILRNKLQWFFFIKIQNFSFIKKIIKIMKISSAKWRQSCPGGDELTFFLKDQNLLIKGTNLVYLDYSGFSTLRVWTADIMPGMLCIIKRKILTDCRHPDCSSRGVPAMNITVTVTMTVTNNTCDAINISSSRYLIRNACYNRSHFCIHFASILHTI